MCLISVVLLPFAAYLIDVYQQGLTTSHKMSKHSAVLCMFALVKPSNAAKCSCWRRIKWCFCAVCLQEGQQYGERRDQSVPGKQEDFSGSSGTGYRLVADTPTFYRWHRFLAVLLSSCCLSCMCWWWDVLISKHLCMFLSTKILHMYCGSR